MRTANDKSPILVEAQMLKRLAKTLMHVVALVIIFPCAMVSGFGRFSGLFILISQAISVVPGILGDYVRTAFYAMTLDDCPSNVRISFGSFFSTSSVTLASGVYIGAYSVLGSCRIGQRSQIASHVQILSGSRQHSRDSQGRILGADRATFTQTEIGADCWLGAGAIIMNDVGSGTTIGAGAVVTHPIPANVVAAGNPARILREVLVK